MRKHLIIFLLIGSMFLISPSLYAFPFIEVEGFVDPTAASLTDLGDGTSAITNLVYFFSVTRSYSGALMDYISLEFESSVFKSLYEGKINVLSGWTKSIFLPEKPEDSTYLELTAGTPIGLGQTLSFSVDAIIYNAALLDPSLWREGDIWGQSWFAFDTNNGGDGGSTAPVPEPTAMLLFGTGLVVSGFLGKKFKKI
jgi:hypothetical protein